LNRHSNTLAAVFMPLAVLLVSHANACYASAPSTNSQTGLKLEQSNKYLGDCTVYLSPTAIKITDTHSGMITVSKAPDWKVTMFNNRAKTIFETDIKNIRSYIAKATALFSSKLVTEVPLEKRGRNSWLHLNLVHYESTKAYEKLAHDDYMNQNKGEHTFKHCEYDLADRINFPKEEGILLARIYDLPVKDGIPIRYKCFYLDGDSRLMLTTLAIKPVKFAASEFDLPKGYKKVKTETETRLDPDIDKGVINLF
jgi:hypothetical protein